MAIPGRQLVFLAILGVPVVGCSAAEELKKTCVPDFDCAAINSIQTPANCTSCADCQDNWGSCTPGGFACQGGHLDLNADAPGCEAAVSDAQGQWILHSTGGDGISSFLFNGGAFYSQMAVSVAAFDEDDPSCVATFDQGCSYTVHALQLEIADFSIPESTWSGGVAMLNGPVAATDDGSAIGAVTQMVFAFDVQQGSTRRIAIASAPVSFGITPETTGQRASISIQMGAVDFGGYEITRLFFQGELQGN